MAGNGSEFLGAWPKADPNIAIDPKAAHAHGNGRSITKAHLSCKICSFVRVRPIPKVASEGLY
jgi:hypothetical protein